MMDIVKINNHECSFEDVNQFKYTLILRPITTELCENNILSYELDDACKVWNYIELLEAISSDSDFELEDFMKNKLLYERATLKYHNLNTEVILRKGKNECVEYVTKIIKSFQDSNKWLTQVKGSKLYIANNCSRICLELDYDFALVDIENILDKIVTKEGEYWKVFEKFEIEYMYLPTRPGLFINSTVGNSSVGLLINPNDAYLILTRIIETTNMFERKK